ncbi:MAG: hypothetical protein SynsKO_26600 [Synoicihabitans sp.]
MTESILTGSDRRALRAEGQLLPDMVMIGHHGLTDTVRKELDAQLTRHQLIKVRATEPDRHVRKVLFEETAQVSAATLIGTVGRTALLFRANPDAKA